MVIDPVLALPDMSKPFMVETDTSDFGLGGVLMQDGHPVAIESRKLKDVERRYSVHEKELLAVVHCLRLWRHYLLVSPFVVRTDNTTVSDFISQSQRPVAIGRIWGFGFSTSAPSSSCYLYKRSSAGVTTERSCSQGLIQLVGWIADDQEKPPICAERSGPMEIIISECHDTFWAGHQGKERTYALMRDDVETYVRTCLICQQDKTNNQKKTGLLQLLPIPKRPWKSVSMEYICGLPSVGYLSTIIVMVDRLSKYSTIIATPQHLTVEGMDHLFFKHIVKYWGLQKDIVSDRYSRFTGAF
ncbi:UNVERIFIED_CONTAM: Retrovirus-related Pol polyprotein from transposon gypsy [Sesamum indicum]